jgi:hypothetical protein
MSDMSNTIPLAYVSRSFCDVVHYTIICIYINPSSQRYGETHNAKAQYSIQNSHDVTKILLKVALNTINQPTNNYVKKNRSLGGPLV